METATTYETETKQRRARAEGKEKVTYQIAAPVQKYWDETEHVEKQVPAYTSPRPIFGVMIVNGKGETTSKKVAVEFADMGYTVTPNPKAPAPPVVYRDNEDE